MLVMSTIEAFNLKKKMVKKLFISKKSLLLTEKLVISKKNLLKGKMVN